MSVLKRMSQPVTPPCVLVVDDDRRVLELLDIAFQAHGFKVVTAGDGDEAIRRIASDRPDLLVMDVRLPKKSGLEVCEIIRRDPTDARMPIILVSAAAETDARLRGFACGADDYLGKPFSPKELVARMRRLLARAKEATEAARRADEFRSELQRMKSEVQRAHLDMLHESRLRETMLGPGRDLQRSLDLDDICRTLLVTIQVRLELGALALFCAMPDGDALEPRAVRGDGFERLHGFRWSLNDGIPQIVAGLGRPVRRTELDSLRDLRGEVAPLIANGFSLLVPLRGPEGLEGLLLAEEPHDGRLLTRTETEELMQLCAITAISLRGARRTLLHTEATVRGMVRAARAAAGIPLGGLYPGGREPGGETWQGEAREIVMRAARASWMPPRQRELLALALECGLPESDADVLAALETLAASDPTARITDLLDIERFAANLDESEEAAPESRRAALLLFVARRYVVARARGSEPAEALTDASLQAGATLDPTTAQALNGSLSEPV